MIKSLLRRILKRTDTAQRKKVPIDMRFETHNFKAEEADKAKSDASEETTVILDKEKVG